MRVLKDTRFFVMALGLAVYGQLCAQRANTPPQTATPKSAAKQNADPASGKKDDQPVDPTKDPAKDPAADITRDPSKDPDAPVQELSGQNLRGGDQTAGSAAAPDYTGPSILSRGFVPSRPSIPANEKFKAFVGVNAVYDSGFLGTYSSTGAPATTDSAGVDINFGISGRHYRRKDIFDLSYTGHVYQYSNSTTAGGQDQSLSVGYLREFSPHLSVSLREFAGLYSNNYSVLNAVAISDTSLNSSTIVVAPNTEAFNDRTLFSSSQGTVIYQKNARLSFSGSAAFFTVNRDSRLLANSTGSQFTGDTAYRITRRQTLGLYYTNTQYSYTKVLSNTSANTFGGTYSMAFSKSTDFSTRIGVTQLETQGLQQVTLSPFLAGVLGMTTGIEKFYITGLAPDFTATLNRRVKHTNIGASYVYGITPGNGLVLTAKRQSGSIYAEYLGFRKYSLQAAAGKDLLTGYVNTIGGYSSYFGRLSATRTIGRNISTILAFDFRRQAVGDPTFAASNRTFQQNEFRISIGFRYNPSELLRF